MKKSDTGSVGLGGCAVGSWLVIFGLRSSWRLVAGADEISLGLGSLCQTDMTLQIEPGIVQGCNGFAVGVAEGAVCYGGWHDEVVGLGGLGH